MVNYTKKAVRGASLVVVMMGVVSLLSYSLRFILAKSLSSSDFGLFYAVFTFVLFFILFRDIGLGQALSKYIAEYNVRKDYSAIKTFITATFLFQAISTSILATALLTSSSFLSKYYFKSPSASNIITVLTLYIITSLFFRNVRSILVGFQDTKWYSLAEPLRIGGTLVFTLVFLYLGFGIMSPAYGFTLGVIMAFLVLSIGAFKYFYILKYKIRNFWGISRKLFAFGIPAVFSGLGSTIILYLDVLMLTFFVPLSVVGVYNILLPTATMFLLFGTSVAMVLLPMVSELRSKGDNNKISQGLKLVYTYSFALATPLLFTIILFSKEFLNLLFGTEYVMGALAFKVLLVGQLFQIIAVVNYATLGGIGKPKNVAKIILVTAFINVVLNSILIPFFSINGAAVSTTVSYFVSVILSTLSLSKFVELPSPWKNWAKTGFSGLVFVFVVFLSLKFLVLTQLLNIIIALILAGTTYIIALKITGAIDLGEFKTVIKRVLNKTN